MDKKIRISIAQLNSCVGDLSYNFGKICSCIEKARQKKTDIIVFPELALTGYPPEDLLLNPDFIKTSQKFIKNLSQRIDGILVLIGAPYREGEHLFNACYVLQNRSVKYVYKKIFLPNYSVFDERRYFTPGEEIPLLFNNRISFSITICEDIWAEKSPLFKDSFCGKAQVIFNISASPFYAKKISLRKRLLSRLARNTRSFLVYCNLVGGQDELVFDGRSLIFSPQGGMLFEAPAFEEDLSFYDIKILPDNITPYRGKFPLRSITIAPFPQGRKPLLYLKRKTSVLSDIEEVYKALVLGTRDYILKNKFQKVVVGLSGGVDSSLTCVIACDAIGRENVTGVAMPSVYSSQESLEDAMHLARNLGIHLEIVSIKEVVEEYQRLFKEHFGMVKEITLQNIQARIRGNILMAFSNNFGWIVLTTGNKSETSVGYCTLYGDTAGGFAVLKDVPKTLVYKLCRWRNRVAGKYLIPERVLVKPPSAELRYGQRDEDEIGSYNTLDRIINLFIEKNTGFKEIVKKGFPPGVVRGIISRIERNEYKRRQSPPGIKITPRSFGKDRRMPITNGFIIQSKERRR